MNLQRLKSFPVIAAASVLLALIVGLLAGSLTSIDAPTASAETRAEIPKSAPGRATPKPRVVDHTPAPIANQQPDRETTKPTPEPRRAPVKPRVLLPGKFEEPVAVAASVAADASILAQVEDAEGNRLAITQLSLALKCPGLSWQTLPQSGLPLGEGRVRYAGLYPGEYRVRSENPAYRQVEEAVTIGPAETDRLVRVVLTPAERGQVQFLVKLEDDTIPALVTVQISRTQPGAQLERGRFGIIGVDPAQPQAPRSVTGNHVPDRETGALPFMAELGVETKFSFAASANDREYGAQVAVVGEPGTKSIPVRLTTAGADSLRSADGAPRKVTRLEIALTVNGSAESMFTSVALRAAPGDPQFRTPTTSNGNVFVWESILSGRWWLSAEGKDVHVAFLKQVEAGGERQTLDIRTGHLRVNVLVEEGAGPPDGRFGYDVRLSPRGAPFLERTYRGQPEKMQNDLMDFFVPEGDYMAKVSSPTQGAPIDVEPPERQVKIGAGHDSEATFVVRPGCKVDFQCLTAAGAPVPGVEYLFTTNPVGFLQPIERARVRRGALDGKCSTAAEPSGQVYLMIWSSSSDWKKPDKVLKVELPAWGQKDLGGIVVAP